ncbi:MAG: hypothetical protein O2944_10840 [Proteobacteria bacterium]|nr:hypothetical protein [Pseudomonadota bacterium]
MPLPSYLRLAARTGLVLLATAMLLAEFGAYAWWCDLFSHFRMHYLFAALCIAVVALLAFWRRIAALALFLAAINGVTVGDSTMAMDEGIGEPILRIVSHNLRAPADRPSKSFAQILALKPDIAIMLEYLDGWDSQAKALFEAYPYRASTPSWLPDGGVHHRIVVVSKIPIRSAQSLQPPNGLPRPFGIRFEVDVAGQPLAIYAVHLVKVVTPGEVRQRRFEHAMIHDWLRREPRPARVAVIGDMNATPYSAIFKSAFPTDGSLKRAGGWPAATWPALLGPLGIPIDHLMVGADLAARADTVGSGGSDHRALWAEVRRRVQPGS